MLMKLNCPNCQNPCEYSMAQKIGSKNCDLRIHFNIVELKCGQCGGKCMLSTKPKKINIFNSRNKIIEF